jgi:hypothetical protein
LNEKELGDEGGFKAWSTGRELWKQKRRNKKDLWKHTTPCRPEPRDCFHLNLSQRFAQYRDTHFGYNQLKPHYNAGVAYAPQENVREKNLARRSRLPPSLGHGPVSVVGFNSFLFLSDISLFDRFF